jgi:hypothetical protein
MTDQPYDVRTLICHAHVEMGINCLKEFLRRFKTPYSFRLSIHEDGSLTNDDIEKLQAELPAKIIRRAEADDLMEEKLSAYPNILKMREAYALSLKLFDTVLMAESDRYLFLDCDVLFMKPFSLPELNKDTGPAVCFVPDRENNYSMRGWQKAIAPNVRLVSKANSGVVHLDRRAYDLDYLAWFVSHPRRHAGIAWTFEQTAWSALAMRIGSEKFSSDQVRVMRENEDLPDLVAGHFTARSRHLLPQYLEMAHATEDGPAVLLKTHSAGECTALDLGRYEMRRLFNRLGF